MSDLWCDGVRQHAPWTRIKCRVTVKTEDGKPSTTDRIKTAVCLLLLLLAYGFVGHMDYEDEARAAAFVCERQYGQQAVFVETDDGWECRPKAAIH